LAANPDRRNFLNRKMEQAVSSKDYQVVWASGEEALLYGYVISFGTESSVKVVRAFLYDSQTSKRVGDVHEYLVSDYPSPDSLTVKIHDTLRKEGADAIVYFTRAFSLDELNKDLKLSLPFPKIKKAE
jgi:hypothetical protein